MPSTYTSGLRLELQANGENNTTWGDKVNNVISLLDTAVSGTSSVDLTGLATLTLSATNGAADQSRAAVVVLTGTLSSNCTVTWPATARFVVVQNNTAGAFDVILAQSGGGATFTLKTNFGGLFHFNGGVTAVGGTGGFQVGALRASSGTFTGNTTVGGTMIANAVAVNTTLGVTGGVTLLSTLNVSGHTGVGGGFDVSGAVTTGSSVGVGGALSVTGGTTLLSTLNVTGAVGIGGNTTITGNLGVNTDFGVAGTAYLNAAIISTNVTVVGGTSLNTLNLTSALNGTTGVFTGNVGIAGTMSAGAVTSNTRATFLNAFNCGGRPTWNPGDLGSYANDAAAGAAGLTTGMMYTVFGTNPLQLAIKY